MSDLIGDTGFLSKQTVPFSVVYTVSGSGAHSFLLMEAPGVRHLVSPYASVSIVSETLGLTVLGPISADKATTAVVGVLPSNATELPTQVAHILTLPGSAHAVHSLYSGQSRAVLGFAPEVTHQIKPKPLIGHPPKVVCAVTITGGDVTSEAHIVLTGVLEVSGVGFQKTW